ncbi:hypothetical protein PoB_005966200 [Plakobranchus ocellatus]|uniref:Uncharacterized protein n=1 Tax=Plakobranchus ocellatus TaxID=259542 RepID=A0AAV4CMV5_9GAST|nr:hypothetical protein PoB_005966200 [Plakobranchus ocellatus]
MKLFAVVSFACCLLAYTVSGTPCADICNTQCSLQKKACDIAVILGPLCETVNGICTQACAAACTCADSCAAQCGGDYATCKGDGSDIFNIYSCGINLSICAAPCQLTCNFNLFSGIVNSLSGTGGATKTA